MTASQHSVPLGRVVSADKETQMARSKGFSFNKVRFDGSTTMDVRRYDNGHYRYRISLFIDGKHYQKVFLSRRELLRWRNAGGPLLFKRACRPEVSDESNLEG